MILTIIITCYNHENFLEEAINSAIHQKLKEKEIIVIENGSSDGSADVLRRLEKSHPQIKCIYKDETENYCKVFNEAFQQSLGKYIIDLSADDILLPEFASRAIDTANFIPADYGVIFCNAEYISEANEHLAYHFPIYEQTGKSIEKPQDGLIYKLLLEKHHIAAPTMVIKREVLENLGGYDENLEYEDFDFWVRSSRNWRYHYMDQVCVMVRKHRRNFGKRFYRRNQGNMLWSTFNVCLKAKSLNQNDDENTALHKRCSYHLRQAVFTEHFKIAKAYFKLIKSISKPSGADRFFHFLALIQWPIYPFYRLTTGLRAQS